MKQESPIAPYCKVCLLPHDQEIHEATMNIREWHRRQVIQGFVVDVQDELGEEVLLEHPRVA